MSDSPGPQPQSQQPPPPGHSRTTSALVPPPSLGDSLHIYSEEAGGDGSSLPRNLSSISFGPEACHVEDIASGCGYEHEKNSILHSATHTPAISRNPSRIDVTHASVVSTKGVHEHLTETDEGDEEHEEHEEHDDVLEMKSLNTNGHMENPQIDPSSKPVEQAVKSDLDAVPLVSGTENINWQFDDMSELQAHIVGPDPFEQLRQQAPPRSSTFPPVPPHDEHSTTAHYDNEKALFSMMASEVATGDGERGMFGSPNAGQSGFFGKPDDAVGDDFFNDSSRSETIDDNVAAMMGQVLDVVRPGGPAREAGECVEDKNARFEEGVPLINHGPGSENEEPDLFGDIDVKASDGFFGGLGINRGNEEFTPGLERKSTLQATGEAIYPYRSGTDVAASVTTANSQIPCSDNLADKRENSLFDALPSATEAGEEDFFGQIGQKPLADEAEKTSEEDDLAARWKAALAGDVLEDEDGFLPSDDEGFLPDSDDEGSPEPVAPTGGADGLLPSPSTGNILFAQTQGSGVLQQSPQQPSGKYTPQQAQPPYRPGQPSYEGAAWQQPPPPPQQMPLNPYTPSQPPPFSPNATQAYLNKPPVTGSYAVFGAKNPQLPEKKVQSFVDKKEGYQSPYDLPLDVAPPVIRKRPSNLGLQGPTTPGLPFARSSSIGGVFTQAIPTPRTPKPKPQQDNFFEELPIAPPKPRTVSAMGLGGQYTPSPANQLPRSAGGFAPPPSGPPRPSSTQGFYSQSPQQTFSQPVSESPQQTFLPQKPSTAGSRYSPALRQASGAYAPPPAPTSAPAMQVYQSLQAVPGPIPNASAPPAVPTKYAPRPAGPPQMGRPPTVTGSFVAPPNPVERQLPQGTGSPPRKLAQLQGGASPQQVSPTSQFQQPQEDAYSIAQRRFSGDHHSMHSSRPGTARSVSISATMDVPREEEEEAVDDSSVFQNNGNTASAPPPTQNRYAPSRGPGTPTPGQSISRTNTFTPPPSMSQSPRYTSQLPNRTFSPETTFQPPPRAQTQSPGMAFGRNSKIAQKPRDPYERPSSAFAHTSTYSHSLDFHQRAQSLQLNFMTPNDEAGRDVLKRWQGAPLFTWGFGGNVAVMFPRRAQRYTSDMQQPMIKCSPGEVKIKNIKEILPLEENEGKFPGPAWIGGKNKGKKKEVLAWMGGKIEALEKEIEGKGKRAEEKLLLWKIVKVLLENDGVLEGNPEIEKVIRSVLTPEVVSDSNGGDNGGRGSFTMVGDISANMQGPSTDRVDPESVRNIKTNLLKGDRTAAVWHAVDKRLWSHALLIAGTVGKDLWKQVVQEFVKHEVKTLGEGVESLAVLYEIFAGNWAESIDELVSASTRVGVPMLGGALNGGVNVEEKLDRWRETLGLVVNNRSPGDAEAILALGKLLVSYGRIEAGHICYVFARQGSMNGIGAVLGGHDDPAAHFSLLGAEGGANFTLKDTDTIMLTEIYELAVSLAPAPHPAFPHLLSYKLYRAMIRAENGHKTEAQKYVDAIIAVIKGWGKSSVYVNPTFMAAVEELNTRLSFAPKDFTSGPALTGAGKWIPKLNSETVTSSIWETFNTFVSGEKDDSGGATDPGGIDPSISGPFARISSESPNMSRVQSGVDLYSAYNTSSNYGASVQGGMKPFQQQQQQQQQYQPPVVAGKYAPQARNSYESQQAPYTPMANHQQKSSSDLYRPSYTGGGYEPSGNPYEPSGNLYDQKPQQQVNPYDSPQPSSNSTSGFGGNPNAYGSRSPFDEAQSSVPTPESSFSSAPEMPSYGGYESPSSGGGYQPPSNDFQPYQPEEDINSDETGLKPKKGFMNDDDDDDDEILKRAERVKQEAAKKAEEEKKNTSSESGGKKGWFGWFGGKKDPNASQGPIKAKLGEESSFVYDPDLKRWVNKKAGEPTPVAAKPPPPPMKQASTPTSASVGMPSRPSSVALPRSSSSEPPRSPTPAMTPTMPTPSVTPGTPGLSAPPLALGRSPSPAAMSAEASPPPPAAGLPSGPLSAPPQTSKPPNGGPPSRPPTAMSSGGGDAMDDLLGPPGANVSRKSTPGVGRKARGKNRYVEVIPGQ